MAAVLFAGVVGVLVTLAIAGGLLLLGLAVLSVLLLAGIAAAGVESASLSFSSVRPSPSGSP